MRLLIISYERLIANGSAGTAVMCGLVDAALNRGDEVTYVALCKSLAPDEWEEAFDFGSKACRLRQAQLTYVREPRGAWKRFTGTFDHSRVSRLPDLGARGELRETYDHVIAFDSLAISLSRDVSALRKTLILGDPAGRRLWHTTRWTDATLKLKALFVEVAELSHFLFTPRSAVLAMFGSGHARFWSRVLLRNVLDLRPFLCAPPVDLHAVRGERPTIYFGGTLAGSASRQSAETIFNEILPALRAHFGRDMFELRLVGASTECFEKLSAPHNEIKLLGRVGSFESELASGDIFILPMNYPVGVRTRICSALAAGNYCLVDSSVLVNMPELSQCGAVRVVKSGGHYAKEIAALPGAVEMARLRQLAREFFESHYAADVAAAPLLES